MFELWVSLIGFRVGGDREYFQPLLLNEDISHSEYFFSFQIDRVLENNFDVARSERIQQYSATVEIQLKAVRCKKFSTIAFVTSKKRPSDRMEKNETSTNEQEK